MKKFKFNKIWTIITVLLLPYFVRAQKKFDPDLITAVQKRMGINIEKINLLKYGDVKRYDKGFNVEEIPDSLITIVNVPVCEKVWFFAFNCG